MNVTFDAAAMLQPEPTAETERIRNSRLDEKPYWHIERCRLGKTRNVPIEVIVNGEVVATRSLFADGSVKSFSIPVEIDKSSWVAVRILPSVHTNPVFVHVDGAPIRTSVRSAQWCADAVDVCWQSKRDQIRPGERDAARQAYEEAKAMYQQIAEEAKSGR